MAFRSSQQSGGGVSSGRNNTTGLFQIGLEFLPTIKRSDSGMCMGALTDVKRQQSKPEPAGDEGIDEDGFVVCNVEFADGETTYFERENLRLAAHTPPPGLDAEAFKEALIGSKADDVLELEMTLPDFIEDEEARGKAATCKLTVSEAFRMIPPSEEELFGLELQDFCGDN